MLEAVSSTASGREGGLAGRYNRAMTDAYICDAVRTPIGRYGGALATVRPDDLAALPLAALLARNPSLDAAAIDEVLLGCANQAGEDNRNVARMAALLAGLPVSVPGATINRLCGSGLDAVLMAARAIKAGEAGLILAGGVESMSRAPFVLPKADSAFSRNTEVFDTTIGWRFVNPALKQNTASIPCRKRARTSPPTTRCPGKTRTNSRCAVSRGPARPTRVASSSRSSFRSRFRNGRASRWWSRAMSIRVRKHTLEQLAKLPTPFRANGTVTAGNASGVNDGACALVIASDEVVRHFNLTPRARIVAGATAGVEPRIMGMGPVPSTRKVLALAKLDIRQLDVIELNEAFASQGLAVLRELGLPDDAEHVNANAGRSPWVTPWG